MAESGMKGLARALGLAVSIGVPLAVLVSCGALAGMYLDRKWGSGPWLTLAGVVVGAVAAFANMIRVAAHASRTGGDGDPPAGSGS